MPRKKASSASRSTPKRDPAKEAIWRQVLAEQVASGLSANEFCRLRGLNPNNFHWWRKEIERRDQEKRPKAKAKEASPENPFVQVNLDSQGMPAGPKANASSLEIVLAGGATIRVTDGTPMQLLARVLKTLEVQC